MRWLALVALCPVLVASEALEKRLDEVVRSSPAIRRAFWGVKVVDLVSGKTLLSRNADRLFVPASNTKLFSTALALMRLGPNHRFHTVVVAGRRPDAEGRLAGDLRLVGSGDPTLSAREIPYRKGPVSGDPLVAIEELAGQVVAHGVRRIDGDIVGDDTAYVWEPYPEGWTLDDAIWDYGAPVSALTLNDNAFRLRIRPGASPGEPALLSLSPALEYYVIDNEVRTALSTESKVFIDRLPGNRQVRLWGTVARPDGAVAHLLAIDDPALFAAQALYEALTNRGVNVRGGVRAKHRFPNEVRDLKKGEAQAPQTGVELARRTSPPLLEALRIINKVSQNLHAELVLREVARVRRNIGSRAAGIEELNQFLAEAGLAADEFHFEDGSGLSRLGLVTPSAVARLLVFLHASAYRDSWLGLMPVGGQDGTLADRFTEAPAAGRVLAKTGTHSRASALSGYLKPEGGGPLVFSVMVNNYDVPTSAARGFIDKIVSILLE